MTLAALEFLNEFHLDMDLPQDDETQALLVRGLLNRLEPGNYPDSFLEKQNIYLKELLEQKGTINLSDLEPIRDNIYLWQGDITRLEVDAIVNAANKKLLGCFVPNHKCIDNAIHSQAGIQLRNACFELMSEQGYDEPTGQAKLTEGFNLPAKHVIHTVGPIIWDQIGKQDIDLLVSCYQSCLDLAVKNNIKSVAFCCISTGEFRFPNDIAAKLAVKTVENFLKTHPDLKVIFNVFKDFDLKLYQSLLSH